jgi:hypothetical protein
MRFDVRRCEFTRSADHLKRNYKLRSVNVSIPASNFLHRHLTR